MVVDVVVARPHELVRYGVSPARHVREKHFRANLVADELRHPLRERRFKVCEEERERAVLPRVLPGVAGDLLGDVAVEVRRLGASSGQPRAPLLFEGLLTCKKRIAVVAKVTLVDQREKRERRLVRPAATGLRVDVAEEVPGELQVVAEHPFVKQRERLELVHPDRPVAVDAARTPLDAARHEEVRRQVDSVLDAGVEESVKLRHLLGEKRRPVLRVAQRTLVVVDSERVVPHARETCAERAGLVVGEVVCREAEIASVEALGNARLPLELEMRPLRNDASVLAGRRVHPTELREVERGAGRDVSRIVQRHPLRRTRDDEWPADGAVDSACRTKRTRH